VFFEAGGVVLVLLIAGVNITNLSLVRATSRLKELATRHALGAARSRVTRQLITETLLLTVIGGLAGLALGYWSLDALAWLGLSDIPRANEIHMDGTVIAFTLTLAVVLGLIVGAVPALQLAGVNLNVVLREEGRTGTAGRGSRHARQGLVVAQVALAWLLQRSKVILPIPGTSSVAHVEENIAAAALKLPNRVFEDLSAVSSPPAVFR
jgi:predicted lysophospholipase L1 biosynthesis ABC-type transport system permease subunit